MNPDLWDQTVNVSLEGGVIDAAPSMDAYRTDLAEQALELLAGMDMEMDTTGEMWQRIEVELAPGGE